MPHYQITYRTQYAQEPATNWGSPSPTYGRVTRTVEAESFIAAICKIRDEGHKPLSSDHWRETRPPTGDLTTGYQSGKPVSVRAAVLDKMSTSKHEDQYVTTAELAHSLRLAGQVIATLATALVRHRILENDELKAIIPEGLHISDEYAIGPLEEC